jgi:uncharacterized peroxidase-related enzyme
MTEFTLHDVKSAPAGSKPILEASEQAWHFVPNLHRVLAEAPAALEGYATLFGIFDKSSLTPAERQVVYLTANFENECHYCMAGHSVLAKMAHVPEQAIQALRNGTPIEDKKLEALRRFTARVVTERGWVTDAEVNAFLSAGYTKQNILEVILGVAVKVISNYTNHVAQTPTDAFMKDTLWTPPEKRSSAA